MQGDQRSSLLLTIGLALGGVFAGGRVRAMAPFVRGDVDQSSRLDVSDAISILRFLFAGERNLVTCDDAADADDSGAIDTSDAVFILGALFRGGPEPATPFPACGEDATDDALGCEAYEVCRFAFMFFGEPFAAGGVFFAVDRSRSMLQELPRAKQELFSFIDAAPPGIRLGIVVFDAGVTLFPPSGIAAEATPEVKEAASAFVESVSLGNGTCLHSGLLAAVDFARASGIRRNALICVSDGGGVCGRAEGPTYLNETLEAVTEANRGIARIHAMGVLEVPPLGERFLKDLASRNGGTYTRVR